MLTLSSSFIFPSTTIWHGKENSYTTPSDEQTLIPMLLQFTLQTASLGM